MVIDNIINVRENSSGLKFSPDFRAVTNSDDQGRLLRVNFLGHAHNDFRFSGKFVKFLFIDNIEVLGNFMH